MSTKVSGSTNIKPKNNKRWKKNKHEYHQRFGCKRFSCLVCFQGLPMQVYYNIVNKKGGE